MPFNTRASLPWVETAGPGAERNALYVDGRYIDYMSIIDGLTALDSELSNGCCHCK